VCGTETTTKPFRSRSDATAFRTSSLTSLRSIFRDVETENVFPFMNRV